MRIARDLQFNARHLANQVLQFRMNEAPAQPIVDSYRRSGAPGPVRSAFPAAVAFVGACGATVLGLVASHAAEPLMLTVMAALATVGVFFLFALAARHVSFGQNGADGVFIRGVIDALDDAILVTDKSGRVLADNEAFHRFAGVNGLGEYNSLETLLAAELGGTEALFRLSRAAERNEHLVEDLQITGARAPGDDGSTRRWFRISVKPFMVPGRTDAAPLALWRLADVTAERALQANAINAFQTQLQHYSTLPIGIVSMRRNGQVTFVNNRLSTWLSHSAETRMRELQLGDLVADGGADLIGSLAVRDTDIPHRIELDLITEDGRRWPAILLVVAHGERLTIGVLERVVDFTGGKATRASEQRFSRFFQSAPFGIASIDADGAIVNSNTAFSRLLLDGAAQRGASVLDILGRADAQTRRHVEAALDAAREAKASIQPFDISLGAKGRELARKISIMSLAKAGTAQPVAGQEAAIVYVHDVTEARALEHKVAQAQKLQAVGTLAGGIAHDFNNVLTAIIGFSDLLLQTHKPGIPSYAHILSVKSSANRAAGLVRQLLAFSRRQTLQPKVLQLGDVLTDWSMLLNRLLGEKIELKIVTGRDLWFVKADPTELERTIINLAVNARDAMLPKGGRLSVRTRNISERDSQRLEVHGVARAEYVLIEVEDNGTGMTREVLGKIFDPFFTTKAVGKGTGLGLASVTGFVQQTGGYIIPESTIGEGTTFRIYLPRYHPENEDEIEPVAAARKPRTGDLTGSGRVLLVEDEDAVRRFAVLALKSKGYEVLQAGNGVEALEVLAAHDNKVDLVVSDVIMPEMDGPTLLKEVRKTLPKTKFIFVSGYPDDAFKTSLDPDTEFTFLPKPYSLAQLAAKVKEQIER